MTTDNLEQEEIFAEAGSRRVNEVLGRPLSDDTTDDILIDRLQHANDVQRGDVVDCLYGIAAISSIAKVAAQSGGQLDDEETRDLLEHIYDLEEDAILVMEDLVA